jgi:hypothetical protein
MLKVLKSAAIFLYFCAAPAAQQQAPDRVVSDNVITSEHDPKIRIQVPRSATYVGADRWILYDIADCELHAFVEANSQKKVQRLYGIQFEGYVPFETGFASQIRFPSPCQHRRPSFLYRHLGTVG